MMMKIDYDNADDDEDDEYDGDDDDHDGDDKNDGDDDNDDDHDEINFITFIFLNDNTWECLVNTYNDKKLTYHINSRHFYVSHSDKVNRSLYLSI
jgi:hypothetical protein